MLLDPPGRDDWRMLAGSLGVDKYIPYFKSLPSYGMSPTVALLTFYELTGQGVGELEGMLEEIGRQDASLVLHDYGDKVGAGARWTDMTTMRALVNET